VIYHQFEMSTHPVAGAHDIEPTERGESYSYVVDQFLRIVRVNTDGTLDAVARDGRMHRVAAADPLLEKPGWWFRLMHRRLFPAS
jgi:hypothetical protein